jgi:type IV secretion system protein VirB5
MQSLQSDKERFMHIARQGLVGGLLCLIGSAAQAQWAVVDAPAIVQLIQEVQTLQEQLQTARDQLAQARSALSTMTGARGMDRLLSGAPRNYLPSVWPDVTGAPLASQVQAAVSANAEMSAQRLATLPPDLQRLVQANRQTVAVREVVAHEALATASRRFDSLQGLILAIGSAADQKAALDLQARIGAEVAMLQNEQAKLYVLSQSSDADDLKVRQQLRERVVQAHGEFAGRFQPVP